MLRKPIVGTASIVAVWLLATPIGALAQSAPSSDAADITGLGQGTLTVQGNPHADTADTYLSVLNASGSTLPIEVRYQASSSGDVSLIDWSPKSVAPNQATRVTVTLGGLEQLADQPVEGQLVVLGGTAPVARAVSITPAPQPSLPWAQDIFILAGGAFVALIALVVIVALLKGKLSEVRGRAPGPKWSYDSWATTLTAVGGILGTAVGAITLPAVPDQIDKDTLVRLNLVFTALIAVGPFVFQAIRNPSAPSGAEDGLWGYSPVLLLSYALTCAAVLGELASLALLGWEVTGGGSIGWTTVAAVAAVATLAIYYFMVTAYGEVTTDWAAKATEAKAAAAKPQKVVVVEGDAETAATKPLGTVEVAPALLGAAPARLHARLP